MCLHDELAIIVAPHVAMLVHAVLVDGEIFVLALRHVQTSVLQQQSRLVEGVHLAVCLAVGLLQVPGEPDQILHLHGFRKTTAIR